MKKSELLHKLRVRGYKITKQREAILDVLKSSKNLLTAGQIFEKAVRNTSSTNFSTVYRNLEMLIQEGIVHKMEFNGDAAFYKLSETNEHHHHLICKRCGSIRPTEYCPYKDMPKDDDFIPMEHRFEVYGLCRDCFNHNKDTEHE